MHNGLITSSSLYPIKYLDEFFVPCGSSFETSILLALMSSILATFCFCKSHFLKCLFKIYVRSTHCYTRGKKSKNVFIIISGVCGVIIYFTLDLN